MNVDRQLFPALVVVAVLLPVGLGLGFGWPAWVWIMLVLVLVCGLVAQRQARHRRGQEVLWRQERAEPPPQPRVEVPVSSEPLASTPLASAKPDYDFLFACTMTWRPADHHTGAEHGDPRALVAQHLVGRAAEVLAQESPNDLVLARHRLAGALSQPGRDRSGRFLVWAEEVSLDVPEADAARLRKFAELRKQEELWEHERGYERNVRAYLGEDVLKDTGSAVVWWLAKHTEQVSETVGLITTLAKLSAAANNTEVDPLFGPPAPQPVVHLNGNGSTPDTVHLYLPEFEEANAVFGRQFADLLKAHRDPERAKRAEESYNPNGQEPPSDEPEGSEQH